MSSNQCPLGLETKKTRGTILLYTCPNFTLAAETYVENGAATDKWIWKRLVSYS